MAVVFTLALVFALLLPFSIGFTQPSEPICAGDYITSDLAGSAATNVLSAAYDSYMYCSWFVNVPSDSTTQINIAGTSEAGLDILDVCTLALGCQSFSSDTPMSESITVQGPWFAIWRSNDDTQAAGVTFDWATVVLLPRIEKVYFVKEKKEKKKKKKHEHAHVDLLVEVLNSGTERITAPFSVQWASGESPHYQRVDVKGAVLEPFERALVKARVKKILKSGKVAVTAVGQLSCGRNCASDPRVVDFVGYGNEVDEYKGTGRAPAITWKKGLIRKGNIGDNRKDWGVGIIKRWRATITYMGN